MTRRQGPAGATVFVVAAAGLLLALVAAHTTPGGYRAGPQPTVSYHVGSGKPLPPLPTPTATTHTGQPEGTAPLSIPLLALFGLMVIALALLLGRSLYRRRPHWRRRDRRPAEPEPVPAGPDEPGELADQLAEAVSESLSQLERWPVREAIIMCWMRLQATTEELGLRSPASDTPDDFVHRVLAGSAVQPEPLDRLARLYREARFSRHVMSDDDRAGARSALESIRAQLGVSSNA